MSTASDRTRPQAVCVIGGGSSGIVAAKLLSDAGLEVQGYEVGSDIGGIWRFDNDSGRSPAYASLETNTSTIRTQYECFPWDDGPPRFVPNAELLEYFESFVDRFDVRRHFRFRTEVTRVTRDAETGAYSVTARDCDSGAEETRDFAAVVVAAGHHWDPRLPDFASEFVGTMIHSRDYRTPERPVPVAGKRVLVVGIGNSACDITCDVAAEAAGTSLSTRSGAHVLPKTLLGRPIDLWVTPLTSRLPVGVQGGVLDVLVRLSRGDQRKFGIDRPRRRLGEEHPTLSQHLPGLVKAGQVSMRPDIAEVQGNTVRFADGSSGDFDVLICATGYHVTFPFLSHELLDAIDPHGASTRAEATGSATTRIPGNRVRLYHNVVAPKVPGLFFLGLVQPLGAIPPLAEAQSAWIAELLTGTCTLPDERAMFEAILGKERELERRFVRSARHTLEVDVFPYKRQLLQERRVGRARAAAARSEPDVADTAATGGETSTRSSGSAAT